MRKRVELGGGFGFGFWFLVLVRLKRLCSFWKGYVISYRFKRPVGVGPNVGRPSLFLFFFLLSPFPFSKSELKFFSLLLLFSSLSRVRVHVWLVIADLLPVRWWTAAFVGLQPNVNNHLRIRLKNIGVYSSRARCGSWTSIGLVHSSEPSSNSDSTQSLS